MLAGRTVAITAPTGAAAINVGGDTLHSLVGAGGSINLFIRALPWTNTWIPLSSIKCKRFQENVGWLPQGNKNRDKMYHSLNKILCRPNFFIDIRLKLKNGATSTF